MLNRRHLRVKVLQVLYAFYQSDQLDKKKYEKDLLEQVLKIHELYFYLLSLLYQVVDFTSFDTLEKEARYIKDKTTENDNLKIAENKLVKKLKNDPIFRVKLNEFGLRNDSDSDSQELVRILFKELKKTSEFEAYNHLETINFDTDREIILFLFKKIMIKNSNLDQLLEERDINWAVDKEIIQSMVSKTIRSIEEGETINFLELTTNWNEDEKYILDLFKYTIENDAHLETFISDKTKNWEMDRIALMDTILMKMAVCEFLNFSSIPVKVTINEYIDISKEFSTPKSKLFINGILDKILLDLVNGNKILKSGRGLLE